MYTENLVKDFPDRSSWKLPVSDQHSHSSCMMVLVSIIVIFAVSWLWLHTSIKYKKIWNVSVCKIFTKHTFVGSTSWTLYTDVAENPPGYLKKYMHIALYGSINLNQEPCPQDLLLQGKFSFRHILLLSHPGLGWLYVFSLFPPRPRPPPQKLFPLTSKPFELDLWYLAQRIYGSGEMYWMTFPWPWPKVTAVASISDNLLVCAIKWEPLIGSLQNVAALLP